jgi:hemerythrin superfamily protein
MSWFHFTKQERLRRNREQRRELAETAKKHAAENIFLIPHDIAPALTAAMDEERTFEEYFREKMPAHLRQALDLEISFWQHLNKKIDDVRADHLTDSDYDKIKDAVRSFLVVLIDVLHAEEEMLTSCLQQHYLDLLQTLQARAAAVPL